MWSLRTDAGWGGLGGISKQSSPRPTSLLRRLDRWQGDCVTHWHGSMLFVWIVRGITNNGGQLLLLSSPLLACQSLLICGTTRASEAWPTFPALRQKSSQLISLWMSVWFSLTSQRLVIKQHSVSYSDSIPLLPVVCVCERRGSDRECELKFII